MRNYFSTNAAVSYPYKLCCPNAFTLGAGNVAWKFSRSNFPLENGTGHVGNVSSILPNTASIGTNSACAVRDSCAPDETCAFNLSNPDGSHLGDCYNSNVPTANSYSKSMCCKLSELCYDGIDNDLDGKIDCADADCNDYSPSTTGSFPQLCSNVPLNPNERSPYNSSTCVQLDPITRNPIHNPNCTGEYPPPDYFYCSYGQYDDPSIQPEGVCCPEGYRSYFETLPAPGHWACQESDECGIAAGLPCNFDSWQNLTLWYNASFFGDPSWCNSQVTNLVYPIPEVDPTYEGSNACCLIPKHGEINYWFDKDNVKI